MPYTLHHTLADTFLDVHISIVVKRGVELEEALQRWSEVANLCESHGKDKILACLEMDTTLGMDKTFQLVTAAPIIGWKKSYSLAILAKDEPSYMGMMFAETAMTGMGYTMKLFRHRRRALKWLRRV